MPRVLGRYHIISELGRGGMGVVYKALDPKLERFIAIKCLSDELSQDEITVSRFLREARNVAALNHPNIAQIYLADEDEGRPYFVMEFIDGETLGERLAREGRLQPDPARKIVIDCAQALAAAFEENIVHRDIKPGNIMIDRRGRTVLTDFGIAAIVYPDQAPGESRYIMGTPGYLPPEVMTGQPADHRGDIFALGAVYYEMLAGRRLVPGSDLNDTARTLLAADFPVLADLDEQLDQSTFGVLGRMLAPQPDRRYQRYGDLLADLGPGRASALAETRVTRRSGSRPAPAPPAASSAAASAATARLPSGNVDVAPTLAAAPPQRRSLRAAGVLTGLLLVAAVALIAVARMAPERWETVQAWFERAPAEPAAAVIELAERPRGRLDEAPATARPEAFDAIAEASDDAGLGDGEPAVADARHSRGPVVAGPTEPDSAYPEDALTWAIESDQPPEAPLAVTAHALPAPSLPVIEQRPPVAGQPAAAVAEPAVAVPAPLPPPDGVLVLGLGDPVFVDPMVRSVEQALAADGHRLVERGFVPGLVGLSQGADLDLAALAPTALAAGAGRLVLLRAMPAGQRELRYHGRSDTAFIVQTEALVYDLSQRRRLAASNLEQIEYTALNATRQAEDSIAPRLVELSAQLSR